MLLRIFCLFFVFTTIFSSCKKTKSCKIDQSDPMYFSLLGLHENSDKWPPIPIVKKNGQYILKGRCSWPDPGYFEIHVSSELPDRSKEISFTVPAEATIRAGVSALGGPFHMSSDSGIVTMKNYRNCKLFVTFSNVRFHFTQISNTTTVKYGDGDLTFLPF